MDDKDAGVPGLSRIPMVGNLFKHKKVASVKSELVILLKPVVVDSGNQWTDALSQSANSLSRLRKATNETQGNVYFKKEAR